MSANPSGYSDLSIDDITKVVGQWSEKSLKVKPKIAKLVHVWHMIGGMKWANWDDIPAIIHPAQLFTGFRGILHISIEDTKSDRYYRYADFRQEIYIDKTERVKRNGKLLLDTLTPRSGSLKYIEKDVKILKDYTDEIIDIFILLINLTRQRTTRASKESN